MEAKVRIQLNRKVDHAPYIYSVHTFPEIVFPIIWLEEVRVTKKRERSANKSG